MLRRKHMERPENDLHQQSDEVMTRQRGGISAGTPARLKTLNVRSKR